MKKLSLLIFLLLISCTGRTNFNIKEVESDSFSLNLDATVDIFPIILRYFEDLDILTETVSSSEDFPSIIGESLDFIGSYFSDVHVHNTGNKINIILEIKYLLDFSEDLKRQGFSFVQYTTDENHTHSLDIALFPDELNLLHASITTVLPKVPHVWNKNTRQTYIKQLSGVFGSTNKEKVILEQEFDKATLTVIITPPRGYDMKVTTNQGERTVKENFEIKINIVDFLVGYDWLELKWKKL